MELLLERSADVNEKDEKYQERHITWRLTQVNAGHENAVQLLQGNGAYDVRRLEKIEQ
jgi:hypothetical protein